MVCYLETGRVGFCFLGRIGMMGIEDFDLLLDLFQLIVEMLYRVIVNQGQTERLTQEKKLKNMRLSCLRVNY